MKTTIFYFSTTGNSLALARAIANGLEDCETISIPKAINENMDVTASRLGFIFPVYGWGVPPIVIDFLKKLKLEKAQYIFAVATCGGTPGRTLLQLRDILRKAGVELDCGFVVKEGANTVTDDPGLVNFMRRISGREFLSGKKRLDEILDIIHARKKHKPETSAFAANFIGGLLNGMSSLAAESFKSFDKNFNVDEKCTECRTCERVCPAANIRLNDGRPVWKHNCAVCYACIQWCPQQAIHIKNGTRRYRNPEITAKDLMLR